MAGATTNRAAVHAAIVNTSIVRNVTMMEFKARILIDSQDPHLAYNELRQALKGTGLNLTINDSWLRNNEPFPAHSAQAVAAAWERNKLAFAGDVTRFVTNDPAAQYEIETSIGLHTEGYKL